MFRSKIIAGILIAGLIVLLLANCNQSGSSKSTTNIKFTLEKSVSISDEKGLIHNVPSILNCDDESHLRFLISPNKLIGFDINKNELTVLFDSIHFNIDSIIALTYQPLNAKKYKYHKHSERDLKNYNKNLFSISPVSYNDKKYYIPLNIKAIADYIDDDDVSSYEKRAKDSIKKNYPGQKIASLESLSFVIIADDKYSQLSIFPSYPNTEDGYIAKGKGSFVFNNEYYFPLVSNDVHFASDSMTIKGMEPNYYFRKCSFTNNGITKSKSIIDKKLINSDKYSWSRHLFSRVTYNVNKGELIASLGKEFLNLSSNSVYTVQPILEDKEFVSNFSFNDNYVIYTTEKYEKEGKEFHTHGYLNSLNQCFLKIEDIRTHQLVFTTELNKKGVYTISPSNNLFEYIENKKELKINKYNILFHE